MKNWSSTPNVIPQIYTNYNKDLATSNQLMAVRKANRHPPINYILQTLLSLKKLKLGLICLWEHSLKPHGPGLILLISCQIFPV